MVIEKINILNFKNLQTVELTFSPQMNCMIGANGSGKTNLLDSIYYLSLTKSAFGLSDNQCIRHGEDFFMLSAHYYSVDSRESIVCSFKSRSVKSVKRNGKEYPRTSEHIGLIPVVLSSPSDTTLISESGEERRRYLNSFLSQTSLGYLNLMIKYNSLLASRNKVLKNHGAMGDLMEVLDIQIAEIGTQIFVARNEHITMLSPLAQALYEQISGGRETVGVSYKSDLATTSMIDLLLQSSDRDRIMGHTTVGIHRDDLLLSIEGLPIRKFGSQGQQKSLLLALKLAQAQLQYNNHGTRPILLLDDVFDKLDAERVANLLRVVSDEKFGQIFITDSNKSRLEPILHSLDCNWSLFSVDGGEFSNI